MRQGSLMLGFGNTKGTTHSKETVEKDKFTGDMKLHHVGTLTVEEVQSNGNEKWASSKKMPSYLEAIWGSVDGKPSQKEIDNYVRNN